MRRKFAIFSISSFLLAAGFYRLAQALLETGEAAQAASAIDSGLTIDPGQFCCRSLLRIDLTF